MNMGTMHTFPLYSATQRGRYKMAKVLMDAGADVNKRNNYGETPLHASLKFFYQGCFNLMMTLGADVITAARMSSWCLRHFRTRFL